LKKAFSVLMLVILCVGMLAMAMKIQLVKAGTITVPDDYPTIQAAINAASDGDAILVRDGTYFENVVLNKSVSVSGENREATIIDASQSGDCLRVTAFGVTVTGFTLRNGGSRPATAYSCVSLSSNGNNVIGNNLIGSWCGVSLTDYCQHEVIESNKIADNLNGISGELLNDIRIISNDIENNLMGIWLGPYTSHSIVSFNNLTDSWTQGLYAYAPSYCTFEGNNIMRNNQANWSVGLTLAFQEPLSYGNRFFHNNIANIGQQIDLEMGTADQLVLDNGYPSGGNYWSDYNGTDSFKGTYENVTGSDGVGDTPYTINANNTDNYPLMNPWSPHDIAVTNVLPSKNIVGLGYSVGLNATVMNLGDFAENFNVTSDAVNAMSGVHSIEGIETESVSGLLPNETRVVTLELNTTSWAYGNYTVEASASTVQGETNTANNNCTGGNVFVTIPGDINGDFRVSLQDLMLLANAYGSSSGTAKWNPNADINGDGTVNLTDFVILASHYGQPHPP
jgi:nitrous oxidase accessory protein